MAATSNITSVFSGLPAKIGSVFTNIFGKIKDFGSNAISSIKSNMQSFASTAVNALSDLPRKFWDIGKNIVSGVWNGIQSMAGYFRDQVEGFFSGIVDGVKDFLGIHSPSKVFAEIGGYMGLGLEEGMTDSLDDARKSMNKAFKSITNDAMNVQTRFEFASQTGSSDNFAGVNVSVPLYLDGREITAASSHIQSGRNQSCKRALGVT